MFFGSKYVYKYAQSEEESVSEEEDSVPTLDTRRAAAAEESSTQTRIADKNAKDKKKKSRKHLRKPDTNILSIKFDRLLKPGEMHAGDPVRCTQCDAYASNLSKIQLQPPPETETDAEPKPTWKCEFCSHVNIVDIEQSELPKQEDATYLITPAPLVHASDMTGIDDSMIIFLIDISGSMSCTTLVQGSLRLPDALRNDMRSSRSFGGEEMTRGRGQTYVTRLQGVQMAVAANLQKLVKDTPTKRALLLSFNQEITYYGDGTRTEPLVIRGDKLNDENELLREAESELNNELKPISETTDKLTERLYDLEECGQTAMGPAVVFALAIASRRPGSQLVICTDGLANRGLGNLESAQDEKLDQELKLRALEAGNKFYADITQRARSKGVGISVITIKGTSCLLPVIGQMADGTGGNVTIVDLMNIRDEFASILEQKMLATNAVATLVLHRALYIRNIANPAEKAQKETRDIGNVTKHTEINFEFGVRDKKELKDRYGIDTDDTLHLPFQIQVTYTGADGSQALRVLTQIKEATSDRDVAEVHAVRSIIAENHIRRTADDIMIDDSDEEETGAKKFTNKYSTPSVQRQRIAFMEKLNKKVQGHGNHDEFNQQRWEAASYALRDRVESTAAKKKGASKATSVYSSSKAEGRRGYGFSTAQASRFNDHESEDLYRFKRISSDYMRSKSPIREETLSTIQSTTRHQKDDDDDDDDDDRTDGTKAHTKKPSHIRRSFFGKKKK